MNFQRFETLSCFKYRKVMNADALFARNKHSGAWCSLERHLRRAAAAGRGNSLWLCNQLAVALGIVCLCSKASNEGTASQTGKKDAQRTLRLKITLPPTRKTTRNQAAFDSGLKKTLKFRSQICYHLHFSLSLSDSTRCK